MEEKSWIWTLNAISQGSENSIYCINILPVLIINTGSPFKLIYTNKYGKLSTVLTPSLETVEKTFRSCLYPAQDPDMKAFPLNGKAFSIKLSQMSDHITDQIIAIQGIKDQDEVLKHKVDFVRQYYSSTSFYYRVSAWVQINDIALEKYLIVCSINCISLIEKSQNVNLNSLSTVFIKDKLGKFWITTFLPCKIVKLHFPRPSILSYKILVSSTKQEKIMKLNKTQSFERHPFLPSRLKPKVEITQKKISKFLPNTFSTQLLEKQQKICFGTYCDLQVQIDSLKKHRRVEAGSFYSLNHQIIRKSLQEISYPIGFSSFKQAFLQQLKDNSLSEKWRNYNKFDNDFIILCPICYVILQVCNELI